MNEEEKKKSIEGFLKKGILISPDVIDDLNTVSDETEFNELLVLNKEAKQIMEKPENDVNWVDFDKSKTLLEKRNIDTYSGFIERLSDKPENDVRVLFSYDEASKKRVFNDFVSYFGARFKAIEQILCNRQELNNITSINRLRMKKDRESVSIIGMVQDKQVTKNKNIMLTLEDNTGAIKVLVNKNRPELCELANDLVFDEVIGVAGVSGDKILFANKLLIPDLPLGKEIKKAPEESYVVFLSDIHVGSNNFLEKELNRFLKWIRGEIGNETQKEIAKKVKHVFIAGDLVDGIGIYPDQESELVIKDIYEQYSACAEFLKKIPSHIQIIICPGNHDAMRISEPQPAFCEDFAAPITSLPNVTAVSNPALINIASTKDFPGFDILLYHGYSFDYYVSNVDSIRVKGGYDRADLIMKFLLQRRHLAPSHTSTPYIPDKNTDPLVINKIPDFFVTGHIHKSAVASYRNVTLICGSCWQSKTSFQERVGHHPEPARVPIVNLKTREMKIMRFEQ
ncbi:MAG: DNA-directed DNA polymerase II small subunit [bacterium]|nr:DNA-directed DNA polymerase II small subunit [bacterium]